MADDARSGGERTPRRRRGGRGRKPADKGQSERGSSDGERFDPDGGGGLTAEEPAERGGGRSRDRRGRARGRGRGANDVAELGASSGIDAIEGSSGERQRTGGLQPGLTLKDLLPFLRPPKTLVVLGASTGSGHSRPASALAEAFKGVDRNLVVRQHDVLELLGKDHDAASVRALLEEVARSPALYGDSFETHDGSDGSDALAKLDQAMDSLFSKKLDQVVVDKRPDHVICTHWLPLRHLEALKEEGRFTASVTAVIPDPDICARWTSDVVANYLVAEDDLKARLQSEGIDPSNVTVTGTPVSPAFDEVLDRDAVMREAGLKLSAPTVLLRPDGIGDTERVVLVVKSMLEAAKALNLVVLAGKNEELSDALDGLDVPAGRVVKTYGFAQNIHELMGVSDLLVSRASPHTMAEAAAAGLPALMLRPSPGAEERMADRVERAGCGRKAYGERDLGFLLGELLGNPRYLRELRDGAEKRRRSDTAHVAVERITKIVK